MAQEPKPAGADDVEAAAARWFFQSSEDVFVVVRGGKIAYVNPAWSRLTGWTAEETVGRQLTGFGHPDDEALVGEAIRRLQETGQAQAEHRLSTRDGGWLWFRSRSTRQAPGALLLIAEDITEERRRLADAEDARRANELLRAAAGVFIWRFNPDTARYVVDPDLSGPGGESAATRHLTVEEMTGEIHPDDRELMTAAFVEAVQDGEQRIITYRHWNVATGDWACLRTAWRGVRRAASGLWEVIGISQDITEAAEARDAALRGERAAQEAAEAKSQFLTNMSHEIRTPMNGVLGVLHLLRNEPLSEDGRGLLDEALGCGQMLSALLNDIVDFSKIEAGRLELAPEPVDPAAVMESVAGLLRPQAEARGLYLKTVAAPAIGWVRLDPVRLRQILFNLVGNAVKFTLSGGVELRLSASGEGEAQRLRLEVQDTGVGIPPERQEALFQRFHQGDGSTTRRFGGSGLGLAITRRLADLMDGAVGFDSNPGLGSTFWVELSAPPAPRAARPVEDSCGLLLDGLRVLVVEDNATNRLIATKMLENLGASVETAGDGLQGLEAVARGRFDLVFMDVQMPVMDGMEATRRIRELPLPQGLTPIIAMTANAMAHQREAYIECGMNGGVSKPLSPAALVIEIAAVVTDGRSAAIGIAAA